MSNFYTEFKKPRKNVSVQVIPVEFFDSDICERTKTIRVRDPRNNEIFNVHQDSLKIYTRNHNGKEFVTCFV
jgi:hypothetical protein